MHVFFSGIGGAGIGPLARIALELGYKVSGSDMAESKYIEDLRGLGIQIPSGQDGTQLEQVHSEEPVDWYVYASALKMSNPNHPELLAAEKNAIRGSKRDEFLNHLIEESGLKLLAVAGTHGKTTTTAMCIWLMIEIGKNPSWSVGGKLPFGAMGHADKASSWFIYECDEFDRNFLSFSPDVSVISGMAYDHHEIYPTLKDYNDAFAQFLGQSASVVAWREDIDKIFSGKSSRVEAIYPTMPPDGIRLLGDVNRRDAVIAITTVSEITGLPVANLTEVMNKFPGISRRFEYITPNVVSDYAHTPEKIAGCLQLASETERPIVAVYEPLTDRRQHFIKDQYSNLFESVQRLYWVPTFQAREHENFPAISPAQLIEKLRNKDVASPAELDDSLRAKLEQHISEGALVVALTGGGVGSLDPWLRANFGS